MQRMVSNYRLRTARRRRTRGRGGTARLPLHLHVPQARPDRGRSRDRARGESRHPGRHRRERGTGSLRSETVLRRNVVTGAISHPGNISGLVVSQPILAGEQVTVRQFSPLRQQGVLGAISGNLRAIALPGDGTQLLYGIVKDGDHVDVVANIKYTLHAGSAGSSSVSLVASRVILRDLLVLQSPTTAGTNGLAGCRRTAPRSHLPSPTARPRSCSRREERRLWLVLRPVAKPTDLPDSVETMQSILGDGLGPAQLDQLTNGQGKGSIGGGQ